jgi:hypothetical protein
MAHRSIIAFAILCLCSVASHARYASLTPPIGFVPGGGPGGSYKAAGGAIADAMASSRFTSTVTKIPVTMRYAAGASRIAARAFGLTPFGLAVAGAAWLASECIAYQNGGFQLVCGQEGNISSGKEYTIPTLGSVGWKTTPQAACSAAATIRAGNFGAGTTGRVSANLATCTYYNAGGAAVYEESISNRNSSCAAGWYITDSGCVQNLPPTPMTPQQMEDKMALKPLPANVPALIPNTALPIEMPVIAPFKQATGEPVPMPGTSPQTYKQPQVEVTPSPTAEDPFRVDVEPTEEITDDPEAEEGPQPIDPAKVNEPDPSPAMCDDNPGILACEKLKLGELEPDKILNKDVQLSITKEPGFPSGGVCPAPKVYVLMGRSFSFSVQALCDFATMIKPLLIGFAWLSAALVFMGVARKES